jgi:F5/8 type C domain/Glycosyl hydrolases family 16/Carbohydrate binding domain
MAFISSHTTTTNTRSSRSLIMKIGAIAVLFLVIIGGGITLFARNFNHIHAAVSWNQVWGDEFNGTTGTGLNTSNWKYDTGQGVWGTGEIENMTSSTSNVYQDGNGHLVVKAIRDGNGNWTSGRFESNPGFQPPAGGMMAFESSISLPNVTGAAAQGYWPAFWALGNNIRSNVSWPTSGEIDTMESINGINTDYAHFHCGTASAGPCNEPNGIGGGTSPTSGGALQGNFHTYRMELDTSTNPQQIRFYLDGNNFYTFYSNQVDATTWSNATKAGFFIMYDLAIGGGWPGNPTSSTVSGASMVVDYVHVYTTGTNSPTATPTIPATATPTSVLNRSGWTASASSIPTDPCCTGDAATNALDGNASTRWSSGVAQAANQWFQVDMKATKSFNSISMDAGTSTGDYPHGYQVFVSNDSANWGSAVASGSGTSQLVTISFAMQSARYIKVVQTGSAGNWWSIHEFNVYGSTAPVNTPTKVPTQPPANTPTSGPTQPPTNTPTQGPTQLPTSNLVSNGGFEAGNTSGWTCDAGTTVVSSPVNSGSHALQLNPTDSLNGQCTQTIAVQANHAYTLSAYVQGNYAYLGVNGGASTWTNSSGYAKLSVPFTTGASQTSITIYVHGWYAQGSVYIDDVVLQ